MPHHIRKCTNTLYESVGTGPSSYEKRIYRNAVSQRVRNSALANNLKFPFHERACIKTSKCFGVACLYQQQHSNTLYSGRLGFNI